MGQALLRPEERAAEGHMIWNFFGQSDRADFSVAKTTSNSSLHTNPTPSHTKNLRTDENIRAAELPIKSNTRGLTMTD